MCREVCRLPCTSVECFGLFAIDSKVNSTWFVDSRWFGGLFEGGAGTVARGYQRSGDSQTDRVDVSLRVELDDDMQSRRRCRPSFPLKLVWRMCNSGDGEGEGYGGVVQER